MSAVIKNIRKMVDTHMVERLRLVATTYNIDITELLELIMPVCLPEMITEIEMRLLRAESLEDIQTIWTERWMPLFSSKLILKTGSIGKYYNECQSDKGLKNKMGNIVKLYTKLCIEKKGKTLLEEVELVEDIYMY